MTLEQIIWATSVWFVLLIVTYRQTGWDKIKECYSMWFMKDYWTHFYNKIEAASWSAKALILIPGLIFGINIWQFYFLTLFTSLTLIWASNKKLLPTLVAFNTMWAWLSCMVLAQHLVN
jgi:hypothetical protein